MFNIFKPKPKYTFTGALPDDRPQEAKEKDYKFKEAVAMATPVNWTEKGKTVPWRSFPVLNQQQQNSCVAHTMAKLLGIMYYLRDGQYLDFSRSHIYTRRSNKPGAGMISNNAFEIARTGVTLESLVKSDYPNDTPIDALKIEKFKEDIGSVLKIGGYIEIPAGDFETVASTMQATGKGVMVWFYFTSPEWSQKFPKIKDNLQNQYDYKALRHSVTAVDFGLIDGKKYIKIEDSAHFGGISERWISEDFFNTRNFYAGYAVNFRFEMPEDINKPKFKNGDVKSLQDCLKYEKTFPANVDSTGFFGPITKKAVIGFQNKYGIYPSGALDAMTIDKLKNLYP